MAPITQPRRSLPARARARALAGVLAWLCSGAASCGGDEVPAESASETSPSEGSSSSGDGDGDGDASSDATTSSGAGDGDSGSSAGDGDGDSNSGDGDGDGDEDPCPVCCPGELRCEDGRAEQCDEAGEAWTLLEDCDPLMGLSCDPEQGACVGACSLAELGGDGLGCDYYPTITQQDDDHDFAPHVFAVAVANPGELPAHLVATRGEDTIAERELPPGAVELIGLPWIPALTNGSGPTKLVADGAYRLRSDVPVHAYQYNPLDATFTNDASLLLPVNAWGERVVVAAWRHYGGFWNFPSLYAVVASQDQTTVELSPSASSGAVQAGSGVAESGSAELVLDRGDVLQVLSAGGDLSGTLVEADKPVQVIGGHECGRVPNDTAACDHLEESIYPTRALGSSYLVAPPVQVPDESAAKAIHVRVIATQPDTLVSFTPAVVPNSMLLNVGDMLELPLNTAAFRVDASEDVLVALYMVGQSAGFGTSDPAMLLAVPVERYRSDYLVYAPPSWAKNFADLLAPLDASVSVDGQALEPGAWTEIPGTGYAHAHVVLDGQGQGTHRVSADVPVGVSIYGAVESGSYWYPAGINID